MASKALLKPLIEQSSNDHPEETGTVRLKGLVIESTGSWYEIETEQGTYMARLKGKFRLKSKLVSNPIAVGDIVEIEPEQNNEPEAKPVDIARGIEEQEDEGIEEVQDYPVAIICSIGERQNHIIRKSPRSARHKHIVAANLDQALLVATVSNPRTSLGFIDRFLTNCLTYHIQGGLIFNKLDILDEKEVEVLATWQQLYSSLGFTCFAVSALTGEGIEELKSGLKDKVSLFAGHSGVGKSSIANTISPGLDLRVKSISGYTGKGVHTTTFARMHKLIGGGYLVDTPGIKEFGIVDLEIDEVAGYFPEFSSRLENCRFNNCMHQQEPGCAVRAALDEGEIAESRYLSYLGICDDVSSQSKNY